MRLAMLFVVLTIGCANKLPAQDSYTITVTYRKCDTNNICKLVTENEKK